VASSFASLPMRVFSARLSPDEQGVLHHDRD
jgi:hypothetical protein